jgi:hypothetical protein
MPFLINRWHVQPKGDRDDHHPQDHEKTGLLDGQVVLSGWGTLRLASPLTDGEQTVWYPGMVTPSRMCWESWCPCCRRPLDVTLFPTREEFVASRPGNLERYAYVAALWGSGMGFVLGALVLGFALKRTGTKHDLVLLHTNLPERICAWLGRIWQLKQVDYIDASSSMFGYGKDGCRFGGVFTKLHALSLTEYDKVLMLDLDLAIIDCPDELFKLEAPAALRRGPHHHEHGKPIDGRCWFGSSEYGWLQFGGINAGVMLLKPNWYVFERALRDVKSDVHPEHIPGGGPEQDYLSRLFAHCWHHISVTWNWQLHQMCNSMATALENATWVSPPLLELDGSTEQSDEDVQPKFREVREGYQLHCFRAPPNLSQLPVFRSADSWDIVGKVNPGDTVVTSGRAVASTEKCTMIPLQHPSGYVDARCVEVVRAPDEGEAQVSPVGFALAEESQESESEIWLPTRFTIELDSVHIFHFSGESKMWDRVLNGSLNSVSDEEFVDGLLQSNSEYFTRLFILKQGTPDEYRRYGLKLVEGRWDPAKAGAVLEKCVEHVRGAAVKATKTWADDFRSMLIHLELNEKYFIALLEEHPHAG